ncbi:hypothetical protein IQ06DRAFT_69534 [Phaeosphaeriaceae sp. SRC1lsM3a]|nr:hypothetical protein IQ06DRAFT_69534 [Stagonospora sp. SRC1lsM3a]
MTRPGSSLEFCPSSHPEWTDAPSQIKHIEQVSHHGDVTSFEAKDDPVHTQILALVWDDRVAKMCASSRRGLANNLHFLLMRDMHNAIATGRIVAEDIGLLNQFDPLNKRYRVQVVIYGAQPIDGDWVENPDQALDCLRRVIDAMIYEN